MKRLIFCFCLLIAILGPFNHAKAFGMPTHPKIAPFGMPTHP